MPFLNLKVIVPSLATAAVSMTASHSLGLPDGVCAQVNPAAHGDSVAKRGEEVGIIHRLQIGLLRGRIVDVLLEVPAQFAIWKRSGRAAPAGDEDVPPVAA